MEEEIRACYLTITVISYNSGVYIEETLNSISKDSSKDVQIILSDDASTDNTLEILKKWKKHNEDLFFDILLLESNSNKGVVQNFSKTFAYAKGTWLKAIAGDDLFYPDAMKSIRIDTNEHSTYSVIIGKAEIFGSGIQENKIIPRFHLVKNLKSNKHFKKYIFEGYTFPGVSFLIKTEVLRKNNVFKHAKGKVEDVPFQLELLYKGYQFKISEHIYVKYRKHNENISRKHEHEVLSKVYLDYQKVLFTYAFKDFKIVYILNTSWNLFFGQIIFLLGNKGAFCRLMEKIKRKLQPKRLFNMISRINKSHS